MQAPIGGRAGHDAAACLQEIALRGVPREQCGAQALLAAIDALLGQVEAWEKRSARAEPDVNALRRDPAFMMRSV